MIKLPATLNRLNERLPEGTWMYVLPFAVLITAVAYVFIFETVDPNVPPVSALAPGGRPGS
jgi:hypothetical protein